MLYQSFVGSSMSPSFRRQWSVALHFEFQYALLYPVSPRFSVVFEVISDFNGSILTGRVMLVVFHNVLSFASSPVEMANLITIFTYDVTYSFKAERIY